MMREKHRLTESSRAVAATEELGRAIMTVARAVSAGRAAKWHQSAPIIASRSFRGVVSRSILATTFANNRRSGCGIEHCK